MVLAVFSLGACSSGDDASSGGGTSGQHGGEGVPALAGVETAGERASEWSDDARLYAIAVATPRLDEEGKSPGWLYTFVSESKGAVATISVEGEKVEMDPAQELSEADIRDILDHTLPSAGGLLDSTEAIEEATRVVDVLEEDPEAQASAGLDSFSGGGEPAWIFAATRDGERIEEKVPAAGERT